MKITVEGARLAPSWGTVDGLIRTSLNPSAPLGGECADNDGTTYGRLVRINRPDGGSNYRGLGLYELEFDADNGEENIKVTLEVKP